MTAGGGRGAEPKYRQIAAALKAAVEAGEYGPGDRLPGENDLMARYGVARMTARQALGVLQQEGLTEARKGAGVFVRSFRPLLRRGIPRLARDGWIGGRSVWADEAEGRDLVVDQVAVGEEQAVDPSVFGALGVEPGSAVLVRRRRFVLDGKPVLLSSSHFPADVVAGSAVAEEDTGPGGAYARLAELGYAPARFREEVRSRMPASEESERLALPAGTPVIDICRTAFTGDGRAVEVNFMTLDAASYVLEYEFEA